MTLQEPSHSQTWHLLSGWIWWTHRIHCWPFFYSSWSWLCGLPMWWYTQRMKSRGQSYPRLCSAHRLWSSGFHHILPALLLLDLLRLCPHHFHSRSSSLLISCSMGLLFFFDSIWTAILFGIVVLIEAEKIGLIRLEMSCNDMLFFFYFRTWRLLVTDRNHWCLHDLYTQSLLYCGFCHICHHILNDFLLDLGHLDHLDHIRLGFFWAYNYGG